MDEKSLPVKIIEAIRNDDVASTRDLLSSHPEQLTWNTPFAGQTWLGYAASLGRLIAVRLLVELGASVNQGDHRENIKPICVAASNNEPDVVRYLLDNGAVLDTETSVQNPLFAAIVGRSPQIVQLLLDAGIDSSIRYSSRTMTDMDAMAFALMRGENECATAIAHWHAKGNTAHAAVLLNRADEVAERNAYGKKA